MPNAEQLELFAQAVASIAESPARERLVEETFQLCGKAADAGSTAKSFIADSVSRGDIPETLYPKPKTSVSWQDLQDPRTVTVERVSFTSNKLTVQQEARGSGVYINGERVGIYDRHSWLPKQNQPFEFKTVHVQLSDNTTVSIPEHSIPVIERWRPTPSGKFFPETGYAISNEPVRISPFTTLSFADAIALRPGAKLIKQFPYQDFQGSLTNGIWHFPHDLRDFEPTRLLAQYPANRPDILTSNLHRVPADYYQQFLDALRGHTAREAQLPEWVNFNGGRAPMASREALISNRPRAAAVTPRESRTFQLGKTREFDSLTDGKSVSVDSVHITEHNIDTKADPRQEKYLQQGLYVDGTRVGAVDAGGERFSTTAKLPKTIRQATVHLSDGRSLSVSSHNLNAVSDWGTPDFTGQYKPKLTSVFSAAPIQVTPLDRFDFAKATALKPGTTFSFDHPFQVIDGRMTDGVHSFPMRRAPGEMETIPLERYEEFLASLKGKTAGEVQLPGWIKLDDRVVDKPIVDPTILIKERPTVQISRSDFTPQPRPITPPAMLRQLTGAETATVDSVTVSTHDVTLRSEPGLGVWDDQGVYLNGERVGNFNRYSGFSRNELPLTLHTAEVALSNGEKLSVSDRTLRVVEDWGQQRLGLFHPTYNTVLDNSPVQVSRWRTISFGEALALKPGDQIVKRYPFQWVGDKLTNGVISLPKVRPEGAQWNNYPIPAVPSGYWNSYLNTLDGKLVDDILPAHERTIEAVKTGRQIERQATLTPRQSEMWNGLLNDGQKCDFVSLSDGVIFKYPVTAQKSVFVVDNPRSGAIYLFDNYDAAEKLATNTRTVEDAAAGKGARTLARESGSTYIIHKGDWKEKLIAAIRQMSDQINSKTS